MPKTQIEPLLAMRGGLKKRTAWNKGLTGEEYKKHYKNGFKGGFQEGKTSGENHPQWKGGKPY